MGDRDSPGKRKSGLPETRRWLAGLSMGMQKRCKPGYVGTVSMPCRSVIYLSRGVAAGLQQSTPRQRTSNPCSAGILDLATHRMYAKECLQTSRWALTPPFHPYPLPHRAFGRSFSVTLSLPSPTAFR